ncbi:MAG: 50S ribosomal protein L20 [Rhodospirillales bacterium]|nr:50S ribosomal protein L20 [Rhodospirillales bacterium]
MSRSQGKVASRARRKKVIAQAKGFRGRSKNTFRMAKQRVQRAMQYQYRDRRTKKRDFRALWIQRINAGARLNGLTYSKFMNGLSLAGIDLDRKVLSDIAVHEPEAFKSLVEQAQAALGQDVPAKAAATQAAPKDAAPQDAEAAATA